MLSVERFNHPGLSEYSFFLLLNLLIAKCCFHKRYHISNHINYSWLKNWKKSKFIISSRFVYLHNYFQTSICPFVFFSCLLYFWPTFNPITSLNPSWNPNWMMYSWLKMEQTWQKSKWANKEQVIKSSNEYLSIILLVILPVSIVSALLRKPTKTN